MKHSILIVAGLLLMIAQFSFGRGGHAGGGHPGFHHSPSYGHYVPPRVSYPSYPGYARPYPVPVFYPVPIFYPVPVQPIFTCRAYPLSGIFPHGFTASNFSRLYAQEIAYRSCARYYPDCVVSCWP